MVDVNALKGEIYRAGFNQRSFAKAIGMSEVTLCRKMNGKGVFGVDEVEQMIKTLNIKDPIPIFFGECSNK